MGRQEVRMVEQRLGWAGLPLVLALAGCSGDEVHECDAGTPTCESSLVILLPDPRTDFNLRVSDDLGMEIDVRCPLQAGDTGGTFGDDGEYTVFCGAGRLQIDTYLSFGDLVEVQLEKTQPREFEPRYAQGADYCGNACTQGTIQL